MIKHYLCLITAAACLQAAAAQGREPGKPKFYSINSVGWIKGSAEPAFQWQTVNGIQVRHFFFGLGLGIDRYRYTGIPVFADGRYYTGKRSRGFFLYEDAGLHYVTEKTAGFWIKPAYTPGFYNDAGIGYKLALGRQTALLFSAGWSYKRVTQTQTQQVCPFVGPCYTEVNKYQYNFNRQLFKLGFGF